MSYKEFLEALELVKQCSGYVIAGKRTNEDIAAAEDVLGVTFSKQHCEFLRRTGGISFFGRTVFGLFPDKKASSVEGDSVAYAVRERKAYNLPVQWIPIISFDDGYVGFLDYGRLNDEGEPPVIIAHGEEKQYVFDMTENEDLGGLLLRIIEMQLGRQKDNGVSCIVSED